MNKLIQMGFIAGIFFLLCEQQLYARTGARVIQALSSGKLLVSGEGVLKGDAPTFAIARLNANGSLDPSFGNQGKVQYCHQEFCYPSSMVVQEDGKILLGGYGEKDFANETIVLLRLNSDGTPDLSFGEAGWSIQQIQGMRNSAVYVLTQKDAKLITVSSSAFPFGAKNEFVVSISRVEANGKLDNGFANNGVIIENFFPNWQRNQLTQAIMQEDGKLVLCFALTTRSQGKKKEWIGVVRLNADGSLDKSFGQEGKALVGNGWDGGKDPTLTLQKDGKLLVGGRSLQDLMIARINTDGSMDHGFGTQGVVSFSAGSGVSRVTSIREKEDGGILAVASWEVEKIAGVYGVFELNPQGKLNPKFGNQGISLVEVPRPSNLPRSLAIATDGTLYVAGEYSLSVWGAFGIASFDSLGHVRESFGQDGMKIIRFDQ